MPIIVALAILIILGLVGWQIYKLMTRKFCSNCGRPADRADNFCRACGRSMSH
jgi:predicted amidophosphoribosyltransferase